MKGKVEVRNNTQRIIRIPFPSKDSAEDIIRQGKPNKGGSMLIPPGKFVERDGAMIFEPGRTNVDEAKWFEAIERASVQALLKPCIIHRTRGAVHAPYLEGPEPRERSKKAS